MADIFISYARADRDKIEKLAAALEEKGYSVWWDRNIDSGAEFSKDIERELDAATSVIVCWSKDGNQSRWVKDEATIAARAGKLKAVSLDGIEPPIGYMQYHAVDFARWNGSPEEEAFATLQRALGAQTKDEPGQGRVTAPGFSLQHFYKIRPKIVASVVAGLMIVIVGSFFMPRGGPKGSIERSEVAEIDRSKSIAVLPFADMSPAKDQEYFSDGIAEEILNVLARVDGLKVASRTSSFAFKDKPQMGTREIADALGVRHVVEGSVRKAGDNVRITAQLIDADTDAHLWSQTFDRRLTVENLFSIQDEISSKIVEELGHNIDLGRANALRFAAAADTKNLRAYELYLEGRELLPERRLETIPLIIEKFEAATHLDPKFARAWEALAAVNMVAPSFLANNPENDRFKERAVDAANTALALKDNLPLAHVAAKTLAVRNEVADYSALMDGLNKAIAVDPQEALVWSWRGQTFTDLGFFKAGESDLRHAISLDPTDGIARDWLGRNLLLQRRVEDARNLYPDGNISNTQLESIIALAFHAKGESQLAESVLGRGVPPQIDREKLMTSFLSPAGDPEEAKETFLTLLGPAGAYMREHGLPADLLYAFGDYQKISPMDPASGMMVWWYWMRPDFLTSSERYRVMREQGLELHWRENGFPPQCRKLNRDPMAAITSAIDG